MSESPRVRLAAPADAAFIRDVCGTYLPPTTLAELIARQDVVVAEVAGAQPVGYAALDRLGATRPFLAAIRVLGPHRRLGVGRALLAAVEARLLARGQELLYSSCTADEAPPQAWHRRMGFQECGFVAAFNDGDVGEILFRKRLIGP